MRHLAIALLASVITAPVMAIAADGPVVSLKEQREHRLVMQQWDASCGAAALATVFTYSFNDPVSERAVVAGLLDTTEPVRVRHRGGFSLLDMKRYAERRGYRAVGFLDMSLEDIRYLEAPIVPLNLNGYQHYVVFRGVDADGDIRVADPAFGNRTISADKFNEAWADGLAFVVMKGS